MAYKIGVISNVGNVREKNEDSVLIRYRKDNKNEYLLAVAADGMGGLAHGECASQCVIAELGRWWEQHSELEDSSLTEISDELGFFIEKIHSKIRQKSVEFHETMGTTLSLMFLRNNEYLIHQAGDSRIYLIHRKKIVQITEDQTWCREQVRAGKLQPEDVMKHPKRHVLSNALGAREEFYLESNVGTVKRGERVLLCTDGYYSYMEKRELTKRCKEPQKLLELSEDRILTERAEDNLSAIMIQV